MTDKRWKRTERSIAKRLGGERVPITGRQRGDAPDIRHPILSLEIKDRKRLPNWLHDAAAQAQAAKTDKEQLAVVVLHEAGKRHDDDVVVVKFKDFCEWFGWVQGAETS